MSQVAKLPADLAWNFLKGVNMANIKRSASELIGNTPLMEVVNYEKENGITGATILVKLEYFNPAGSVKDRVALYMIEEAEREGKLKPGGTIIEPTSGNTGIGLASVAAEGYQAVLTLPETMSVERRKLLQAYGAKLVLTDGALGMKGAIEKAEELQAQTPGSVILGQFDNPANPAIHRATTGPEIWEDTDGKADIFLISLKAGGTGLNLTAADIVIHYDPWWNLAAQNQATDRAHRIGQDNKVTVLRLIIKGTIEERILKMQEDKQNLADSIISEGGVSIGGLDKEQLISVLEENFS